MKPRSPQPAAADAPGDAPDWAVTLARLMDSRFAIPGTRIRFGWDTILGLLPVAGDSVTALIGMAIVVEAIRRKRGPVVVARMLLNLGVDWLLGLVPLVDVVLDTAFKANLRNLRLLTGDRDRR